ncbi:MAG: hypothetical protein ACXVWZ_06200 [Nocardioides sp.]
MSSTQHPAHRPAPRGRRLAALASVAGFALAGAAVAGAPSAQSAPPPADCAATFPVASLAQGDPVTALSVTSGTTPQTFTGSVIGVLKDGIGAGVDMVMVRIDPPSPDGIGGIWQGMSGSPVYAADGRLVGAIAYGLSYGPSWVAGVTPYEDMDDYLGAARPGKVQVGAAQARAIAARSDVTASEASQGFSQLPMPTGVSGLPASRLAAAGRHAAAHRWLPRSTYAMGQATGPGDGPGEETVVAGGNLAATLSYGDVTQGGVGTATSVCDGKVVGFGHPLTFLGATSLSLHPATALYVQPDSLGAPFKVANLGAPVGTITDDHLTGITGTFGTPPPTTDVTSTVTYGGRSRTGTSHVSVPAAEAATTFYEQVANHQRVVDAVAPGSELLSWTITGHDASGAPFSLSTTDRFASDYDISFDSSFEVADFVYSLSSLPGVGIDDVTLTSDVVGDASTWRIGAVQQHVGGQWVTVRGGHPALARAGHQLRLRALLTGAAGSRTVPFALDVPAKAAGQKGRLELMSGAFTEPAGAHPTSVAQAQRYVATYLRNDQLGLRLDLGGRDSAPIRVTGRSAPVDKVVYGARSVPVRVR